VKGSEVARAVVDVWLCVRAYPKTGGEFLLKQTLGGEKVVGASGGGGDAMPVVGYRKVVKREFARESPLPLRLSPGVGGSRSVKSAREQPGRRTKRY